MCGQWRRYVSVLIHIVAYVNAVPWLAAVYTRLFVRGAMYERCAWRYVTVVGRHDGLYQQRAITLAASPLMQCRVT